MSGALRAWLLALVGSEAAAVRGVQEAVGALVAPLMQAVEETHSVARRSDVAARSAEMEAAAAVARSNAAVAEAAAALRGQAEGAVRLQRELAETSHWGAALRLYLPSISPLSPLYLPYISPISPRRRAPPRECLALQEG